MSVQELALKTDAPLAEMNAGQIMLNVPLMMQIDNMAVRMATAKATIPAHLVGNEGDCWAIIMQAIQWGMNPYVVAQKTHLVSGKLGYEAQLVNAVVQSSGAIVGPFRYEYQGEGNALECRVGAILKGDSEITWNEWLSIASVTTKNSPLWKTNPKQQMGYLQLKNWTRAYAPGPLLGIYTVDELEAIPVSEREVGPGPKVSDLELTPKKAESAKVIEGELVAETDTPRKPGKKAKPAPEPEPEEEAEELRLAATYAEVMQAINDAACPDTLRAAFETMKGFLSVEDNTKFREELTGHYSWKKADLIAKADADKSE